MEILERVFVQSTRVEADGNYSFAEENVYLQDEKLQFAREDTPLLTGSAYF
jgi:hypothetical protein